MRTLENTAMNINDAWIHERTFSTGDGQVTYKITWTYVGKFLSRRAVATVTSEQTGLVHSMTKTNMTTAMDLAEIIFADYTAYKALQETDTTAPESVHIITELSQAARMIEYVESTCFNHEDYGNILTSEQCNELHAMFDQLDEIISNIKK